MHVETFYYTSDQGWSVPNFPDLDSEQTFVVAFCGINFLEDQAPIKQLAAAYPKSVIVGCSTCGEVYNDQILERSITVAVARFEYSRVRLASAPILDFPDTYDAAESIVKELVAPDLKGVFLLSDGLKVVGNLMVKACTDHLPNSVMLGGGLAGDEGRFEKSWVIHKGKPKSQRMTAVGFYGDRVFFRTGAAGGYAPFGEEKIITRAQGSQLFELDGEPALQVYQREFNATPETLLQSALLHPLGMKSSSDDSQMLVRLMLAIDESQQSCLFAGDIRSGDRAYFMTSNADQVIQGAAEAAKMTIQTNDFPRMEAPSSLTIATSCISRKWYLQDRVAEELRATLGALPSTTKQVGFYSYGEICSTLGGQKTFQNQTMTIARIEEL
jgi:hypothetical protein